MAPPVCSTEGFITNFFDNWVISLPLFIKSKSSSIHKTVVFLKKHINAYMLFPSVRQKCQLKMPHPPRIIIPRSIRLSRRKSIASISLQTSTIDRTESNYADTLSFGFLAQVTFSGYINSSFLLSFHLNKHFFIRQSSNGNSRLRVVFSPSRIPNNLFRRHICSWDHKLFYQHISPLAII